MRVSIVARLVRTALLAAVVVPAFAAACSNDPLAPAAQPSRVSGRLVRADSGAVPRGTIRADVSVPWYRNGSDASAATSDVSVPWYRNGGSADAKTTDVSVPWY